MTVQNISREAFLEDEINSLSNLNKNLLEEIQFLKEQIEWFRRQLFGQRSEKIIGPSDEVQLPIPGLENLPAVSNESAIPVPGHLRKKPNRDGRDKIILPDDLPIEKQIIDLPEEEKICKETGVPLVKIGEEISQKLAHRPGSYYIKQTIRPKYAVPKNPDAGVAIAPLPDALIPRCQADESFLAEVLVRKYADHQPLYRQSEILAREGIQITRQLLSQWVIKAGIALKPLYNAMKRIILESDNVFCDETPIDLLAPGKGKTQQGYMWVIVGGKDKDPAYRLYDFYENRKHSNAEELLRGYTGVLHSDKYGAYEALANAKQFIWCPCYGHIRRKFIEAETGDPPFRDWVLRKVRYLFMLERVAWERPSDDRLAIRREKEVPIIDELIEAIKNRLIEGKALPKSKFREALGYFTGLIPHLKNYTKHPFARLDNNVAERAVRPLALGRKNWLFIGSEDGGEATAIIYSLVQTCRSLGVNPREYLRDVMKRLPGHSNSNIEELLPDRWQACRSKESTK